MKHLFNTLLVFIFVGFISCTSGNKEMDEAEMSRQDSLSKVTQRRHADSLKRLNPLLIIPPDSNYTGDYIDKYPNGVIKFRGFYRFGKRHGHWVAFYINGEPWSEQHYDKGLKQGENKVFYTNGKIRYQGYFKADKRDSVWTFYDSTGYVQRMIVYSLGNEVQVK